MKPGLELGNTAAITAKVTPDMYAQFEGQIVHRAYSTVSMVYHMEWAARQIILPYLEADEEGIGGGVTAKHVSPTAGGDTITATATVTGLKGRAVITAVEVHNGKQLVGTGEVTQYVLPRSEIEKKLASEQAK
ncbi:thioesterase family protein [Alicyclobacillus sp. SO9]|uniref:thioesterase family protein n=1 Tax=Alicyclobacillus sp. SO9 TaxID=2665646 RepID=UPI0018E7C952|nr:thioesterase [Alicyclobacillus sp. SO9]QQE79789.1 thioesterase [Alicyclobacillus sp. SO9]